MSEEDLDLSKLTLEEEIDASNQSPPVVGLAPAPVVGLAPELIEIQQLETMLSTLNPNTVNYGKYKEYLKLKFQLEAKKEAFYKGFNFVEDEMDAFQSTKKLLLEKHNLSVEKISNRELMVTVINCKCRPDQAASKYVKWLESMTTFGINSFDDVYKDVGYNLENLQNHPIKDLFTAYAATGTDMNSRSIMWIKTRPTQIEEETLAIRAGVIYFMALHADPISLRQGITFVLDTTKNDMSTNIGNESKLQKCFQSIPLRPQRIFIMGANWIKRIFINSLITIASFFTKEKVLERIMFCELEDVRKEVSDHSLPTYLGYAGGGIASHDELLLFIQNRIQKYPIIT